MYRQFKSRKPGHPAVVVLDIKMSRMDGIEVLRAIRSDPGLKLIPMVMLTSSREEQDLIRSGEAAWGLLGLDSLSVFRALGRSQCDRFRRIPPNNASLATGCNLNAFEFLIAFVAIDHKNSLEISNDFLGASVATSMAII